MDLLYLHGIKVRIKNGHSPNEKTNRTVFNSVRRARRGCPTPPPNMTAESPRMGMAALGPGSLFIDMVNMGPGDVRVTISGPQDATITLTFQPTLGGGWQMEQNYYQ